MKRRNPADGGPILTIRDSTATLDVWKLPSKIVALRWPRAGLVRAMTLVRLGPDS